MLQSWAVKDPCLKGESRFTDVLDMSDLAFSKELGSLYSFGGGDSPPGSFGEALTLYMENANISVEALAFDSGISERSISEMRNKNGYRPKITSLVAICIAMHLSPSYCYHLIELAGYKLTEGKQDIAYRFLIDKAQEITIEEANRFLIKAKLKPL